MSPVVIAARRPSRRFRSRNTLVFGAALLSVGLAAREAPSHPALSPATLTAAAAALEGSATLVGTVGAPGGIVVDDATVEVTELHREVPVDDTGAFRIENVPAGQCAVSNQ